MKAHHFTWIGVVVALVLGYFLGVKFPGSGQKILGAVPSVSP